MPRIPPDLISFDDSTYNQEAAESGAEFFREMTSSGGGSPPSRHGEGLDHVWSGILGMTSDMVPLVGQVEEGQWICAGFNGHGK